MRTAALLLLFASAFSEGAADTLVDEEAELRVAVGSSELLISLNDDFRLNGSIAIDEAHEIQVRSVYYDALLSQYVPSAEGRTISGGGATRIFEVYGSVSLVSVGLTAGFAATQDSTGGLCDPPYKDCAGGLIYVGQSGRLSLTDCTLTASTAWEGGALYTYYGVAATTRCLFEGNSAIENGGAAYVKVPENLAGGKIQHGACIIDPSCTINPCTHTAPVYCSTVLQYF